MRTAFARIALVMVALTLGVAHNSRAQIAEERFPPAELPASALHVPGVTSQTTSGNSKAANDWRRLPASAGSPWPSATAQPPALVPVANAAAPPATPDVWATPTAAAVPPALDLSATNVAPDLGAASLEPEFKRAMTPARAASLRLTERARKELLKGDGNGALQDLGRAVSIDPGNPFEYYYLGRVYLARHNLGQAATFFQRAELGFAERPDWLGETLSFEGACNEQLGRTSDAAKAYKNAVALAPGNFRAQAGLGRLAPIVDAGTALDQPPPADSSDVPPPAAPPPPPAPYESPVSSSD